MAVDQAWLASIRQQNQQKVGLAGMGTADDLAVLLATQARKRADEAAAAAVAQAAAVARATGPGPELIQLPQGSPPVVKYLLAAAGAILVVGVAVKLFKKKARRR